MKKNLKRVLNILLAGSMLTALVSGCSTPGSKPPDSPGTVTNAPGAAGAEGTVTAAGAKLLRLYQTTEPPTLDPLLSNAMPTSTVTYHIYDGLMRNNNGIVEPGVATGFDLSDDGLTYTFHLRDDAKWSDGELVTADQFVYGLQRLMNPDTAATMAYMGEVVKNGAAILRGEMPVDQLGITAPDEHTVIITLERPTAYFSSMLSGPWFAPMRKDIVEKHGQSFASAADKAVYNGPFVLTSWEHDSRLTFTKNENYWNKDAIKLDTVELYILSDPNTPLGMFEGGQLDFVEIPSSIAADYVDKTTPYHNGSMDYLQINLQSGNAALSNLNFRLALSYGISRQEFTTLSRGGVPLATSRLILPVMQGHTGTFAEDYPEEPFPVAGDMAKAKEYLDKAMQELGVSDPAQLTFKLNYAETESTRKIVEVVQAQWKQNLGVTVELNPMPYAVLYTNQNSGDFEMMYTGWTPDYDDPMAFLELFVTGAGYNHSHHENPEYDAYIKAAQNTIDVKERADNLAKAEQSVCQNVPIIVLDADRRLGMWDETRIQNFRPYYVNVQFNFMYADIAP